MSAKLKIFLIFTLSIFATAVVAGVYKIKQWHASKLYTSKEQQPTQAKQISNPRLVANSRGQYRTIPLTKFRSILKGTDPAALAMNAFDTNKSKEVAHQVEVVYPQPNQAMVTITQTNLASSTSKPVKYRVELTSFGRSLFVTSPPLWQVVWAGSSEQCLTSSKSTFAGTNCP